MAGLSDTLGKAVLLLKDTIGEKSGGLMTGYKKKEVPVLRGALLILTSSNYPHSAAEGKPAHNYSVFKDDITLYCSAEDVVPLANYEFQILSGISTLGARYDAFIDDTLDWGSKLKVDDAVYVGLPIRLLVLGVPTSANAGAKARVRWIGVLPGELGVKFGIEITVICLLSYYLPSPLIFI